MGKKKFWLEILWGRIFFILKKYSFWVENGWKKNFVQKGEKNFWSDILWGWFFFFKKNIRFWFKIWFKLKKIFFGRKSWKKNFGRKKFFGRKKKILTKIFYLDQKKNSGKKIGSLATLDKATLRVDIHTHTHTNWCSIII